MKFICYLFVLVGLAILPVYGNSYVYEPLEVPKAEDIVAFTNGLPPSTGVRITKTRDQILKFLRRGKNNLDVASWDKLEYPDRSKIALDYCDGMFVDKKGQFYFWILRTPKVLKLQTADGRSALLQLP